MNARITPEKKFKLKEADIISLYTALGRINDRTDFRYTQGYESLRQLSYASQRDLADDAQFSLKAILE